MARTFGIPFFQLLRQPALAKSIRLLNTIFRLPPPATKTSTTTRSWIEQSRSEGCEHREIFPAGKIERKLPRSIDEQPHWHFRKFQTVNTPPVFLAKIPQGHVIGKYGSVVTKDGTILGDVSREWFFGPEQHSLLFKLKSPPPQKISGTTVTLAMPSGWNYYHWLVDVLPRLAILEMAGVDIHSIDSFAVNAGDAPFQKESLEILGIPASKRIPVSAESHYVCEKLVVPSPVGLSSDTPKWAVEFLRRKLIPKTPSAKTPARIYVSRSRSKYRIFTNETEVRAMLVGRGFEEVFTEQMTFRQQIELFANASAMVAPHGAGLANLLFCSRGAKVIEIFSPDYVNGCFWALANWAELDYFYLLGAGPRPAEFYDPHRVEKDITVDLKKLEQILALAEIRQ